MISASANPERVIRRISQHAERIARNRAQTISRSLSSKPLDWHSAASLWPDLELD